MNEDRCGGRVTPMKYFSTGASCLALMLSKTLYLFILTENSSEMPTPVLQCISSGYYSAVEDPLRLNVIPRGRRIEG
jgi:hypothetical protein